MSSPSYTFPVRVRLYDLDLREQVSCSTLLRYFEETAMQASSHMGFTLDWYNRRGQFWVVRTMRLERSVAALYEDEVEIRTWVSAMTRVRADRNYVVRRVRDGRVLARATANWVYLDRKTLQPSRIAPEIVALFINPEPAALPARKMDRPTLRADLAIEGQTARHASYFEADSARHTNNAVYVDWLEEAVRETLLENGYMLALGAGPSLWFYHHSLEYLNPSRPRDSLEIITRLVGRGRTAGHWRQEIRRAGSRELVVRSESTTIWIDDKNRPTQWPNPAPTTRDDHAIS